MALRYVAVLPRSKNPPEQVLRHLRDIFGDPVPLGTDDVILFASNPRQVIVSARGRCVCLGRIFAKTENPSPVRDFADEDLRPLSNAAAYFNERFWGGYVAIVRKHLETIEVIRDPSGALPCYLVEEDGVIFLASDVAVLADVKAFRPAVDFGEVGRQLQQVGLKGAKTGIAGLLELRPGFSLVAGGSHFWALEQRWNPRDYLPRRPVCRDADFPEQLRSTVERCIRALASSYDQILLTLSGGLDSSIVAAGLVPFAENLTCLTLVAPGSEGDERGDAVIVAQYLGLRLECGELSLDDYMIEESSAAHLPRPAGSPNRQMFDKACLRFGANAAHFNGNGGDNVFAFSRSTNAILDRLASGGSCRETWKVASDLSNLSRVGIWSLIRHAIRNARRSARPRPWAHTTKYLDNRNLDPDRIIEHEWLAGPGKMLPGERAHISKLLTPQNHTEGFPRSIAAELVTPLLAQPIVEMCLSVPSWRWCEDGLDRSQARQAFSNRLPQRTLARTAKGGPTGLSYALLARHGAALRDHLLGGCLAEQGLLDRPTIEAAFQREHLIQPADDVLRLLELADSESWARIWVARTQ